MHRRRFNGLLAGSALAATLAGLPRQAASEARPSSPVNKPAFKFSIMLWTIAKQVSFDTALELAAAASYQGVELVGESKKWSPAETQRILARLKAPGLTIDAMSGVDAGFANPAGAEQFLSDLKGQLQAAQVLGCPQLILLSGSRVDTLSPAAQHATCVENLKRGVDMAARFGVQLLIEPIDPLENPSIYLASVTEGFAIAREVASPHLKVLYDLYHEQRAFGNLIEKLEANIDLVGLVHVADVPGRHEPGTGEINYGNIYRRLADLHYSRFIAMEYYPTGDLLASFTRQREFALRPGEGLCQPGA